LFVIVVLLRALTHPRMWEATINSTKNHSSFNYLSSLTGLCVNLMTALFLAA